MGAVRPAGDARAVRIPFRLQHALDRAARGRSRATGHLQPPDEFPRHLLRCAFCRGRHVQADLRYRADGQCFNQSHRQRDSGQPDHRRHDRLHALSGLAADLDIRRDGAGHGHISAPHDPAPACRRQGGAGVCRHHDQGGGRERQRAARGQDLWGRRVRKPALRDGGWH